MKRSVFILEFQEILNGKLQPRAEPITYTERDQALAHRRTLRLLHTLLWSSVVRKDYDE